MELVNALVGLASLFFGRVLFWLFVGAAGFALGFALATQFLGEQSDWLIILVALAAGVLGALLAVFAQRLAVAVAGFVAGGYLFLSLMGALNVGGSNSLQDPLTLVLCIIGGILGAAFVVALFDPALIVLSSLLGASLLANTVTSLFAAEGAGRTLVFVLLLLAGVAVQWAAWQRGERISGAADSD